MNDRSSDIHAARVYLSQARHWRKRKEPYHVAFFFTLLEWAANARRKAAIGNIEPQQIGLDFEKEDK